MKLIFSHDNMLIVANAQNCLMQAGIEVELRNEFSASGMGELSPIETWPELWVHESWYRKAKPIVDKLLGDLDDPVWHCDKCSEENEDTFLHCWHCQTSKGLS